MDRAEDQRRQQARSANDWDREKAQLEKENRQTNFDLQQVYSDQFKKDLQKNIDTDLRSYDTKIKEAEAKSRKETQNKEFLMKMAPSLVRATGEAITARDEHLYKNIKSSIINAGLSNEELKTYLFADKLTSQSQAAFEKVAAKLQSNGAISEDDKNNILNLSGRKKLQAQKYYAQNLGKSAWQSALANEEHYNNRAYDLGDGRKLTFNQVINGEGTLDDLDNMYRQFDSEYYSKMNAGSTLLAAESKPYIDRYKETQRASLTAAREKRNAIANKTDIKQDVLASINTLGGKDPGQEFIGWINRKGALTADRGYWRKEGLSTLSAAAQTGELDYHVWLDIKNEYFKLDGQKKEVRFGDIYKSEVAVVDEAFKTHFKNKTDDAEQSYKNFDVSKRMAVGQFFVTEGRHMNNNEIKALKSQFKVFGKEPEWLKNYESQSEMETASADLYLTRKGNQGTLSYIELVGSRKYSKGLVDKHAEFTYDGPNTFDSKDIFSGITASVQTSLGNLIPTEERGFESKTMGSLAKDILRERVNNALAGKMYASPREAYIQEASKLNKEILEGNGIWELKKNLLGDPIRGIKGGFKYLDSKYSRDFDTASIAYERAATKDKTGFLTAPGTIDKEDIESLKNLANGGKFPNFLGVLANRVYTNKDHYEIANDLLRANGEDEVEPPGMARTPRYVSDSFKRMVLNKPSMAKTIEAVNKTTEQLNPGTDVDEPALNLMKDKEAVAKGGDNYVLDKSGRTNTVDIASYAAGDVYNTFRVGNGVEFGVYKFTGKEIGEAIDKGIISSTDIFDQATQETLQLERFESTGEINLDGYTLPGVGQAWVVPEVSTNEALRTVFGDLTVGLAKNVVKEEGIEAIATVADTGNKLRKAVINKIKDPATKAFFKRLGNTVVQETKEILAEEKTNLGEKLAESTKEDVKDLASLFMQAMAEVDEQMKNYTINKRTRRLYPIDPNNTFSQRGINPYKLKPELFGEFYQ
jgi:hypothetical protein